MSESRSLLTPELLSEGLAAAPGWRLDGGRLTKEFSFPTYAQGVLFAVATAQLAERLDHHPEMWITWGKVTVTTWTHTAGGVTRLDLELARGVEALSG